MGMDLLGKIKKQKKKNLFRLYAHKTDEIYGDYQINNIELFQQDNS